MQTSKRIIDEFLVQQFTVAMLLLTLNITRRLVAHFSPYVIAIQVILGYGPCAEKVGDRGD